MVCNRCKLAVRAIAEKQGLQLSSVELGEIETTALTASQTALLDKELQKIGFELIDTRKGRIIEKIKTSIIALVHYTNKDIHVNLSEHITSIIPNDYTYLSNLFSEVEGTTIEKYFISQKIERVKELLVYDELTLSEIAGQMGYSSVAYLSSQFKKVTGLTPSFYKSLKNHKRQNIDHL